MTPHEENWLALRLVEGLGAKSLAGLLDHFGTVEAVHEADPKDFTRYCGIRPDLAERIARSRDQPGLSAEKAHLDQHGATVLPLDHPGYPRRLLDISLPPPLLYWLANATANEPATLPNGPCLAVVGTRTCTRYGEKSTRALIEGLARLRPDTVILSGLARGIDTVAHAHALECGLSTIAVLGTGLGRIYPPENTELAGRIIKQGGLISEFPMNESPRARNFPIRNRILSGMSDAVLVIEAGNRSGALITAGFAQTHRRRLLALPGNVDQPGSLGTNRLIQNGEALLVQSAEDLAAALAPQPSPLPDQLDWFAPRDPVEAHLSVPGETASPSGSGHLQRAPRPSGDKGIILDILEKGPLHPDDLAGETEISIAKLVGLLLELELSGEIVQTAENHYALA